MCDRSVFGCRTPYTFVASPVLVDNPTGSRLITQDEGGCVHSRSGEV